MTEILIFKLMPIENDYFTWYCVISFTSIAEHSIIISMIRYCIVITWLHVFKS